jgi:hypothetical protein
MGRAVPTTHGNPDAATTRGDRDVTAPTCGDPDARTTHGDPDAAARRAKG